jgi:hypothetical protein
MYKAIWNPCVKCDIPVRGDYICLDCSSEEYDRLHQQARQEGANEYDHLAGAWDDEEQSDWLPFDPTAYVPDERPYTEKELL